MWNLGYRRSGSPRRRPCHRYTNTVATNSPTSSLACPRAVHLLAISCPQNSSLFRSDESQTRRALRVAGKNERKRLRKRVKAASRDYANDQYRRGGTVALTTTLWTISRSCEQHMVSTVVAGKAHVAQVHPRCRRPRRSRVSIWKWLHHSDAFARDTHLDRGESFINPSLSLSLSLSLCLSGVRSRDCSRGTRFATIWLTSGGPSLVFSVLTSPRGDAVQEVPQILVLLYQRPQRWAHRGHLPPNWDRSRPTTNRDRP